jgi:hypothetical protein
MESALYLAAMDQFRAGTSQGRLLGSCLVYLAVSGFFAPPSIAPMCAWVALQEAREPVYYP